MGNKTQAFKVEYIRLKLKSYGLRNRNPAPKVEYIRLNDVPETPAPHRPTRAAPEAETA